MNTITPKHTYNGGWITLRDLRLEGLPEKMRVNNNELLLKTEFHITLVSVKQIAQIVDPDRKAEIEKQIVSEFLKFCKSYGLDEYSLKRVFYLVKKDKKETVVVLCEMPGLKKFFGHLQVMFNTKLPVQPAHITLYTLQQDAGIGILSYEELHQIGEPIALTNLQIKSLGKA